MGAVLEEMWGCNSAAANSAAAELALRMKYAFWAKATALAHSMPSMVAGLQVVPKVT